MLIDENYINSLLFAQFYNDKVFSLTETLLDLMPDNLTGGTFFIRALMSSQVWRPYFPGLATYRTDQRVDFRCGFGQEYLKKGHLQESKLSQVTFKDGNKVELDFHVGCSLYVFDDGDKEHIN